MTSPSWRTPANYSSKSSRVASVTTTYCELGGILQEERRGFRPHRSTVDMMFGLRRLKQLARKKDTVLFMCFIDPIKAYDSVDRTFLWAV